MENINLFSEISKKMSEQDCFLIFPHLHPDGDALGSSVALAEALRLMNKEAWVLVEEAFPHNLDFLDKNMSTTDKDIFKGKDYISIMLDCSDKNRIINRYSSFERGNIKIVIDHHLTDNLNFKTDYEVIEPKAAATGELVYNLIKELGVSMNKFIADSIFTAITTDTGNFQHSNTTALTHKIAMELYDVSGFNSKPVSNLIYNRESLNSIQLEKLVIDSMMTYEDGKIVIAFITNKMLIETNTDMSETDRFINKLMTIEGVEIAAVCKQDMGDKTKVSLRSKNYTDVSKIAKKYGGGGHERASGFNIDVLPYDAPYIFVDDLKKAINI